LQVLLKIGLPIMTFRIDSSDERSDERHHFLDRGGFLRICRRQQPNSDGIGVQLELDKESMGGALFDGHRLEQGILAASGQVEFLNLEYLASGPLKDRCEGLVDGLKIAGFFDDDVRHECPFLHMISQHQLLRVWIEIDLVTDVAHVEYVDVVLHQRQGNDQGRKFSVIVVDHAQ
jgi:hypothetical protein